MASCYLKSLSHLHRTEREGIDNCQSDLMQNLNITCSLSLMMKLKVENKMMMSDEQ